MCFKLWGCGGASVASHILELCPRCVHLRPQQLIVKPLLPGGLHVFLDQACRVAWKPPPPHAVVTAASTAAEGSSVHSASLPACLGIVVDKRRADDSRYPNHSHPIITTGVIKNQAAVATVTFPPADVEKRPWWR